MAAVVGLGLFSALASSVSAAPTGRPAAQPANNTPAASFTVLDAFVVPAPLLVGGACPAATTANHSAPPGAIGQTIAICGRNLANAQRTPTAANSSLGGSFIVSPGTFTSGRVEANSGIVVLGNWANVTISAASPGPGKTILAKIGSNPAQTSPLTALSNYSTNETPVAAAVSASTNEDTPSAPITLSASDPNGDPLTFSINSGPTHGTLGTIVAAACPPTTPAAHSCTATVVYTPAANYNGSDSFTYIATDSHLAASAPATVSLIVNPVNDTPVIGPATFPAAENTPNGSTIGSASATDVDTGQTLTFTIQTGNTDGAFAIDASTGAITVANSAALDYETTAPFSLAVRATDNGSPVAFAEATITVNLTDVNEPPTVSPATFTLAENSANGTVVGTATYTDQDAGQTHEFAITAGNTDGAFAIDSSTGAITVANSAVIDFETNPSFGLTIRVTDNGTPALFAAATITVDLTDVNEPPTVSAATFSLAENSANGTVVGTATYTDQDAGQTHQFAITAGNTDGAFAINTSTGAITVGNAAAIDFETNPSFGLTIRVTDNGSPVLFGDAAVTVNLTDVNDAPDIVTSAGSLDYTEGDPPTVIDGGLTVTDVDSPHLAGASVQITDECTEAEDALTLASPPAGISVGTYDPATCLLTLTGDASAADYQAALRSVTYSNSSDDPSEAGRTVTFTVNDGLASDSDTRGITVTGVGYRILLFTKTELATLPSTAAGVAAIEALGVLNHFGVDVSVDGADFTEPNLARYQAVVFLNNAGEVLDDPQQDAFEAYFRAGGGFVGIHAAIEAEPGWQFYTELLGARVSTTLAAPSAVGATNIKLALTSAFVVGSAITIDSGASSESATISSVGSAGNLGTGITLAAPLSNAHESGSLVALPKAPVQSATVKVFDRVHDATKDLPEYWDRTDAWYNFTANVRGTSHVLATVVEDPFGPQPQGPARDGIAGGTMGADHPVIWCKDYQGGRSFYTAGGNTPGSFAEADFRTHLGGAIKWAAGLSDPVYSDCGATVLANYRQVKISIPPNLNEPIGFDQLPDGRIIQTARTGTVRLHNPATGTTQVIANFADPSLPQTQRLYTNAEDGLYGPAVDNDFVTNHWVYLYYAPQTVTDVKLSDGSIVTQTTPTTTPPNAAASVSAWDPYVGYFQLSRFKFIDDASGVPAHLDMSSEQQILRVPNNRQECCHNAGDIDFDTHNNLWLVTGNDTPVGGIGANGYGPFNDQLTDEAQTVRVTNATGGTFTLTFNGQTTAPLAFNSTAAQIDAALEALPNIGASNIQTSGGPVNTANVNVFFRGALQQSDQPSMTANASALTGTTPTVAIGITTTGGWYQRPTGDARRSTLNTNDLRGKVLRIKVRDSDISPADANKADFGTGGAYTIPAGNLFPLVAGAPQLKTRPEVYAMGFQNPFRLQVDEDDVAYVSDYGPDANSPQRSRGPAGVGRWMIIRQPANYGFPICYSSTLGYYRWSFHEFVPGTTTAGIPLDNPPQPIDCAAAAVVNDSRWNLEGGPGNEIGLLETPPITDPEIWYSYNDNRAVTPLGTPCFGYYATTPGAIAPGSTTECPRLFPELFTGGVGPHGAAKYHYDPANPSTTKFPPYYDGSVILGEFTQDTLREVKLDSLGHVFKINKFLDCGAANVATPPPPFRFECDNPMDMQWGADGNFYLLTYGDGFFNQNADAGMYRWEYVKGQRQPIAKLTTDRTDGALPLTVQFSSAGSNDPDPGDSISFDWDFGDGTPHSTDPNPSHEYTTRGRYTVVLTVTDSSGNTAGLSTVITAGNTSPSVAVTTPVEGGTFAFGDVIPFTVAVTDPEDGTITCADIQVTFVLGHDTHGHAETGATGCSGLLPTIAGDAGHGGNVFGVISATYTDHGVAGDNVQTLSTTGQTVIRQKHQEVEFVISQSGTTTVTTSPGEPVAPNGSALARGSLAGGDWIKLNGPFNLVNINSITYRVADASAGRTAGSPLAAIEIHRDTVTGPIVQTNSLVSTGGTAVWTSQNFPISLSGTHDLFLVFRATTGGATGANLFNLNWIEFQGQGIAAP